ncbi:uncharacterized protein LOC127651776 [Xyrauchen texanus]|uniref:uncharacterized protein LOC127651776 n=1 Tax=Xyrauchen texanus TaxID=154827 RepID=UPI002242701C|nr:uncharacterized protein LOC127651776 [Xyrauchen texanus]
MWLNSATRTHLQAVTCEWLSLTLGVSTSYPTSCDSPVPPTPPPFPSSLYCTSPPPPVPPVQRFTPPPQNPSSKHSPVTSQGPITSESPVSLYSHELLILEHNQDLYRREREGCDNKQLFEDLCVKEQSLKQNYDPPRLIGEPDPNGQLMSMYVNNQLPNELKAALVNQSKNIANQELLPKWSESNKLLSISPSHKSENIQDEHHDIYEKMADELPSVILSGKSEFQSPVAALTLERLPELYIQEEDDETINRSGMLAVSKKEVELAV